VVRLRQGRRKKGRREEEGRKKGGRREEEGEGQEDRP
jgi:hypothetical protein